MPKLPPRPNVVLPDDLRKAFLDRGSSPEKIEKLIAARARPQAAVRVRRVSDRPVNRGAIGGTLLGEAEYVQPSLVSKFGGEPYCEEDEDWSSRRFFAQFLFSDDSCPEAIGIRGMLRLDCDERRRRDSSMGFQARWFSSPSIDKAKPAKHVRSYGKWEAAATLEWGWSLARDNKFFALADDDEGIWELLNDWEPEGFVSSERDLHWTLFGWPPSDLSDLAPELDDVTHRLLARFEGNLQVGWHWGTNFLYFYVPVERLASGAIADVVAFTANV